MKLSDELANGGDSETYRKGLVLGLTMAEVGILIIFVLILLLLFDERSKAELTKTLQQYADLEPLPKPEVAELRHAKEELRRVAEELGMGSEASSGDFIRLARVIHEAMQQSAVESSLSEARSTLAEMRLARRELQRGLEALGKGGGEGLEKLLEEQSFRIANQEGLLKLRAAAGHGKDERPCWVGSDGRVDFLYDVVLTSKGIKMREYTYASRQRERAGLPAHEVDATEVLRSEEFVARIMPLFQYSQRNNCRFSVVVYDGTSSDEKELYKSLLGTVEGHFYKRLASGPAPF